MISTPVYPSKVVQTDNGEKKVKNVRRIIASHPDKIDVKLVEAKLAELTEAGRITERDESLLEHLREFSVLSLDQVHRLLWPDTLERVAYNRLYALSKYYLVGGARVPSAEMVSWKLPVRKVYTLGAGGWGWILGQVSKSSSVSHLRRDQVIHDLLVAEIYVRVWEAIRRRSTEDEEWDVAWAGEKAASCYGPNNSLILSPDGLAIVKQQRDEHRSAMLPFFIELDKSREAHGRPSSDWGHKVGGYDFFFSNSWKTHPQLTECPSFPWVLVITHGQQRLSNLAQSILQHRKTPVIYFMGLWEDVIGADDFMTAPIWLVVTQDGGILGHTREERQSLLPPASAPAASTAPVNGKVAAVVAEPA